MYIYTSEQIKEADQLAETLGMETFALMENAGSGLYRQLAPLLGKQDKVAILSGKGNNGGDGIVLARYLKQNGYDAELIFPLGLPKTKVAARHFSYYKACGFKESPFLRERSYDWVVDGLLGVGAKLPLREDLQAVVKWINSRKAKVVAIDVPTGVASDTGEADPNAVKAGYTFSLHGFKPSGFLYPSSFYFGKKRAIDIGLPQTGKWKVWTKQDVARTLPKRAGNVHKGTFGTGLLAAGSDNMPGSAALAAIGAIRMGIGKLSAYTTNGAKNVIAGMVPEATYMERDFSNPAQCFQQKYAGIAIGPGLEPDEELEAFISQALELDVPVVLDAGALGNRTYPIRKAPVILTPHPGEFSRMTGIPAEKIAENRIQLASRFAKEQQVVIVLKGQYTVIAFPDGSGVINPTGNGSLAKGGSGDTLTGMLLAAVCTHEDMKAAVANTVYIHGACADAWVRENGSGTLAAHEFSQLLPKVMHEFEGQETI
ncbi:bifunctional ADP-dependent NAD(P)H-hydrate dehydratase/NAD(P)H-hydrate epimerase [Heyndrickxia acidiproducens]|uniref:bifunctional ADP-dependent NAD(P)H-hydrate dehydratase/NAD(P)H-hydrate epimerase n=1 Tax=Heyndrickxia acidiproducens TaxID=1121084 RepID=UPI00036F8128|nr:bifunctional ADP-dependent NAD(P)H-hydrate dehydratase/NAD(P)H-hydrate epimerase [Heyndrickxia acidiproducens]